MPPPLHDPGRLVGPVKPFTSDFAEFRGFGFNHASEPLGLTAAMAYSPNVPV